MQALRFGPLFPRLRPPPWFPRAVFPVPQSQSPETTFARAKFAVSGFANEQIAKAKFAEAYIAKAKSAKTKLAGCAKAKLATGIFAEAKCAETLLKLHLPKLGLLKLNF